MSENVTQNSSTQVAEKTRAGGYFVTNYPPFSHWSSDETTDVQERLAQTPDMPDNPLGLYLHIPFCRQRCHFCYFRVYTDKNAKQIHNYNQGLIEELRMMASQPFIQGRPLHFVYFGGGTPSYLSVKQLTELGHALREIMPWNNAKEIAFECEPGTLSEKKLDCLRDELGITRLSLGVENFSDKILEQNGRAHLSRDIIRAYGWARERGFDQINIDLIAGMMGETDQNWNDCIQQAIAMAPEAVTIYQMEIPQNTTIYKEMQSKGSNTAPVADWPTKRRWVREAFEQFEQAGYTVTSAYTVVRDPKKIQFVYRDALWHGADMLSLGVAAFGHIGGVHYQNEKHDGPYLAKIQAGQFPHQRAKKLHGEEPMIRELILQMKLGHVSRDYFRNKFNVDLTQRYAQHLTDLTQRGLAQINDKEIRLTRTGLLQADTLLEPFFLPEHR